MVKIKICGITNLGDALAAVEAGADMLGFNFYRPSPRFIEPATARAIIEKLPATTMTVGVFVNEREAKEVAAIANEAGITGVQLHGDESPEYCRQLKGRYLIKVLQVDAHFRPDQVTAYEADAIMLDAFDPQLRGGTGRVIDWLMAAQARPLVNALFLSGGLSPENVAEAISQVAPFGVDACSRLESAPGRKNLERMRSFIAAARAAEL
jgi:phosphoribosylanthranilate isomerase